MDPIQFVDLRRQTARLREEIDEAVARVVASAAFIKGPDLDLFESELATFTGASHVIGVANGTDALQLSLMALELEPGDEVITPDFTYFATAEVIALLGLKPVLVDVDPRTFTVDPQQVEAAVTGRTRVILPVHLYGQCADMAPLLDTAARHGLAVVEDAAQAIGAVYTFPDGTQKQAGTMGTLGATSFFPSKNLGCFGDGGAVFTHDQAFARRVRMLANHGQSTKYVHDLIGINSRLDTLQAAILRVKLRHLPSFMAARRALADAYDAAMKNARNVAVPHRTGHSTHVFHQYTLTLPTASRLPVSKALLSKGVPTAIYYPAPIHAQEAFKAYRTNANAVSNAKELCARVLSLPMHTEMDAEQTEFVTKTVAEAVDTSTDMT